MGAQSGLAEGLKITMDHFKREFAAKSYAVRGNDGREVAATTSAKRLRGYRAAW